MELSSVGQAFTPAAPLHIQRLNKALQLDVLLKEAEKVFTEDLSILRCGKISNDVECL